MKRRTSRTEQKEETHERILDSATTLLRRGGIDAASVGEVMKGAGLTVGGFYAHFDSKDALVADALHRTMDQMRGRWFSGIDDRDAAARFDEALKRYLSRSHRDHPERGCAMPAVAGEMGRADAPGRRAFATEFAASLAVLAGGDEHRRTALGALALMVGGVSLARALRGTPLSDEILTSSREFGRAALRDAGLGKDKEGS